MGQGAVGARLAALGAYTGVEPDSESQAVARARLPKRARILRDSSELDPSEKFDVVCAFEVLEHIEDDLGAARAWAAHLEAGGDLVISVPAHAERFAAADRLAGHFRRYSRGDLADLVEAVGLDLITIDATGFPLGYLLEYGRNQIAGRRQDRLSSIEEQTAASGRFLQPPDALAPVTQAATYPFRVIQRATRHTQLGTGWVAIARRTTTT